jgi:hypothetical protein
MKILSDSSWRLIEDLIKYQREQLAKERERVDRLTEAVARKEQVPLVMPQAPSVAVYPKGTQSLEKGSGYFDVRRPEPPKTPEVHGGKPS